MLRSVAPDSPAVSTLPCATSLLMSACRFLKPSNDCLTLLSSWSSLRLSSSACVRSLSLSDDKLLAASPLTSSVLLFMARSFAGSLLYCSSSMFTLSSLILAASLCSRLTELPFYWFFFAALDRFLAWTITSPSSSSLSMVFLRADIFWALDRPCMSRWSLSRRGGSMSFSSSSRWLTEPLRRLKLPLRENLRILKLCCPPALRSTEAEPPSGPWPLT